MDQKKQEKESKISKSQDEDCANCCRHDRAASFRKVSSRFTAESSLSSPKTRSRTIESLSSSKTQSNQNNKILWKVKDQNKIYYVMVYDDSAGTLVRHVKEFISKIQNFDSFGELLCDLSYLMVFPQHTLGLKERLGPPISKFFLIFLIYYF